MVPWLVCSFPGRLMIYSSLFFYSRRWRRSARKSRNDQGRLEVDLCKSMTFRHSRSEGVEVRGGGGRRSARSRRVAL